MMNPPPMRRRTFLLAAAGAAASSALAGPTAAARTVRRWVKPDKLRIAMVGTANRARASLDAVMGEQIVALCDVDRNYLREAAGLVPDAATFEDYREMLSADLDIDAVIVATPDHMHAPPSTLAMRAGKHVYCEKPLTHTVHETRLMTYLAKHHGLATQMGTQIHAEGNYRRVVELLQSGAIGAVREAHVWCGKSWSDGRFGESKPAPQHLNWNSWLGPAPERPYCDGLHPGNWRRYWDYGTGTLGDMACHYVDLVFWALKLKHPHRVEAWGPEVHRVGTPQTLKVRWDFPKTAEAEACTLWWYDGGPRPEVFGTLKNPDGSPLAWGDGQLFVGETGMVISDYGGHRLLREGKVIDFTPPTPTIPDSIGHHAEWLKACRDGTPTTCNFGYSGPLTETVLLGTVAYRAGEALDWDPVGMAVTNSSAGQALITKAYREGWRV